MLANPFSSSTKSQYSSYLAASSPHLNYTSNYISKPAYLVSYNSPHLSSLSSSGTSSSLDAATITRSPYYSWNRSSNYRLSSSQLHQRTALHQNPFYRSSLLYKDEMQQAAYSSSYHTQATSKNYHNFSKSMMSYANKLNNDNIAEKQRLQKQKQNMSLGSGMKDFGKYLYQKKQAEKVGDAMKNYGLHLQRQKQKQLSQMQGNLLSYGMNIKKQNQNYEMGKKINNYAQHLQKQKQFQQNTQNIARFGSFLQKEARQDRQILNKKYASNITDYAIHIKNQTDARQRNVRQMSNGIQQYGTRMHKQAQNRQWQQRNTVNLFNTLGEHIRQDMVNSKQQSENPPNFGKLISGKSNNTESEQQNLRNINKILEAEESPSFKHSNSNTNTNANTKQYPQHIKNRGKTYYQVPLNEDRC